MSDQSDLLHQPKLDRNALVVRHNDLIESRHKLSIPERRFMLWLISQIHKDDEKFKKYRISVNEFVEFAGLEKSPNYYTRISEIADSLSKRSYCAKDSINKVDTYFPWFDKIRYDWGSGFLEAHLNSNLSPYLLDLKASYTAITLEYALLLKSSYSGRIYDLLKQYQKIGERIIRIDDLRNMLELENKYAKYRDFRKRVIESAEQEINKKTDISFSWEGIKEGRKFASIRFTIWKEAPTVSLDNREESEPRAQKLYRKLCSFGIAEKTARSLIDTYDDERIDWHINEYAMKKTKGKAENVGWLVKGIKTDYRPPSLMTALDQTLDGKDTPQKSIDAECFKEAKRLAETHFMEIFDLKKEFNERVKDVPPENIDLAFLNFVKYKIRKQD